MEGSNFEYVVSKAATFDGILFCNPYCLMLYLFNPLIRL